MRLVFTLLISLSLGLPWPTLADVNQQNSAWMSLFDGKTLNGWQPKITGHVLGVDPLQTFSVEDGLLKVRYNHYKQFSGQFGHLFYDTPLTHYALHIEYRFVGNQAKGGPPGWAKRNSGVMLHAQDPRTMSLDQQFPISIEAQFLGGLSDHKTRPTANVCSPGTDIEIDGIRHPTHCLASSSATYDGDQWVNVVIVVLGGGSIIHYVEDEEVLRYARPTIDNSDHHQHTDVAPIALESGFIALQSESHPIDFRTIRLLDLSGCTDRQAKNFAPYLLKSRAGACKY